MKIFLLRVSHYADLRVRDQVDYTEPQGQRFSRLVSVEEANKLLKTHFNERYKQTTFRVGMAADPHCHKIQRAFASMIQPVESQ